MQLWQKIPKQPIKKQYSLLFWLHQTSFRNPLLLTSRSTQCFRRCYQPFFFFAFFFYGEDCFHLTSEKKNEHNTRSNESLIVISIWYLPFQSNILIKVTQMILIKVTLLISPMSVSQLEAVIWSWIHVRDYSFTSLFQRLLGT